MSTRFRLTFLFSLVFCLSLAGCGPADITSANVVGSDSGDKVITIWGWPEEQLPAVFADFYSQTHIRVIFESYESQEAAIDQLKHGASPDLVLLDNQLIQSLILENGLAKIDIEEIPNIYQVTPEFLNQPFDPGNHYTVPYTWGTTGLLARSDMTSKPVNSWAELWNPEYSGKVVLWKSTPRHTVAIALKMLGYSINTEKATELEKAVQMLKELKDRAIWLDEDETCADLLTSGQAVIAEGWSYDALLASKKSDQVKYIQPDEGAIIWADSFVIPAGAQHPHEAEKFLNYILSNEVAGKLMNLNYFAMPILPAMPFVEHDLANNPIIFPSEKTLGNHEILQPLSLAGEELFNTIWAKIMGF